MANGGLRTEQDGRNEADRSLMDALVENRVCTGPACDGSYECQAELHIHGCYSDDGSCDEPDEHDLEDLVPVGLTNDD